LAGGETKRNQPGRDVKI